MITLLANPNTKQHPPTRHTFALHDVSLVINAYRATLDRFVLVETVFSRGVLSITCADVLWRVRPKFRVWWVWVFARFGTRAHVSRNGNGRLGCDECARGVTTRSDMFVLDNQKWHCIFSEVLADSDDIVEKYEGHVFPNFLWAC